jgi:hypothetical protein
MMMMMDEYAQRGDLLVHDLRCCFLTPCAGNIVSYGPGADALYATGNGYVVMRATV